ncbi:MAG: phage major capsid protein [Actinomycetota bacterium]
MALTGITDDELRGIAALASAAIKKRGTSTPDEMPDLYGGGSFSDDPDSPGKKFASSPAFKAWMGRFPSGGPATPGSYQSDPVSIPHGFRALVTSADASAGTMVPIDQRGLMEPGLVREIKVPQLLSVIPTSSDTIEYVKEEARVSAAAPVAEATGVTGTSGLKPEGGVSFAKETVVVRTFAVWIPCTTRILKDATGLRAYVDRVLRDDLSMELEDQVLAGAGTGENFLGILNHPDILSTGPPGAGESVLHVLRNAIRQIKVNGKTSPTAVVMHPADGESLDLIEVNSEENHFVGSGPYGPVQRSVWGLPVVESEAIAEGIALVGDFTRAALFDRESFQIAVGTVGDQLIRNLVTILAETRAGFAVIRPKAFAAVDLAA